MLASGGGQETWTDIGGHKVWVWKK